MVGGGINGTQAQMQADVGIAMGSGTDIAVEPADIILLRSELAILLRAREISRSSCRKMTQSVALALCFIRPREPLAATRLIPRTPASPRIAAVASVAESAAIVVSKAPRDAMAQASGP